jgi:succinate dehydrogenase hydrophobic anchor subunit
MGYPSLNETEQLMEEVEEILSTFPPGEPIDTTAILLHLTTNYFNKTSIESLLDSWAAQISAGGVNAYSKDEVDTMLQSYATIVRLNTDLANYITNTGLAAVLESYITENDLSDELASYVTAAALTTTLGAYATTANVTSMLASYVTNSGLSTILQDYNTADEIASILNGFVTSGQLATSLQDYITSNALTSILNSYVTSSSLTSQLTNYVTGNGLTTILNDYITSTQFATTLSSYVTASTLSTTLANYVTTSGLTAALSDYVTSSQLTTAIADFLTQDDLTGYATTTDLANYVLTSTLTTILDGYVSDSELTTILNSYATTAMLSNYVTSSSLASTLSNYVTGTALSSILGDYVTTTTFSATLSNYVTSSSLVTILNNYVTSTALTTILGSYVTTANFTTANITESANKRFVTDAQLTVIQNTSNTNTGDETAQSLGTKFAAADETTTIANTDLFGVTNSAASHVLRKITWANFKTVIKSWLDAVYVALPAANGFVVRGTSNVSQARTITGSTDMIAVENGDGAGGNPTLKLALGYYKYTSLASVSVTSSIYQSITVNSRLTGLPAGKYVVQMQMTTSAANNVNAFIGIHAGNDGATTLVTDGEMFIQPNAVENQVIVETDVTITAGQIIEAKVMATSGTLSILAHAIRATRIG